MASVTITISADEAARLQLAIYSNRPELFPLNTPVILNRSTNAVLLASDGEAGGMNYKALTNAQITSLIQNGKPADDTAIVAATKTYWTERIRTAIQTRKNHQDTLVVDPMSGTIS